MKASVYDSKGKEVKQITLPKDIFNVEVNLDLLHQVVVSQMSNRRKTIAHTKDRGEVRGGGRKPWRQKGTGRARHGSRRSPIWIGGGVTFGPRKEKIFKKGIPRKMRRKALFMALSAKAKGNLLTLLDKLELDKAKTKEMFKILGNLPCRQRNVLLILPSCDKKIILASKNIPGISTIQAKDINVLDLLSFKYLLMPEKSIKIIKNTFAKTS